MTGPEMHRSKKYIDVTTAKGHQGSSAAGGAGGTFPGAFGEGGIHRTWAPGLWSLGLSYPVSVGYGLRNWAQGSPERPSPNLSLPTAWEQLSKWGPPVQSRWALES